MQFFFWLLVARSLPKKDKKANTNAGGQKNSLHAQLVSVVVAAKDEANNLPILLSHLKTQQYAGDFEVIVVNDRSVDGTLQTLLSWQKLFARLRIISVDLLPKGWDGKKNALIKGIASAKGEVVLLTDADCRPCSPNWIGKMTAPFADKTCEAVLGVGRYQTEKGLLNAFIRYETLITAVQYLTFWQWGFPYMAVGRNVAYRKEAFLRTGFGKYSGNIGGDDDLMINRLATPKNTRAVWLPEAQTISIPQKNLKTWYRQKIRHLGSARYYKKKYKILLMLLVFSQILGWSVFFYAVFSHKYALAVAAFWITRLLFANFILKKTANKLNLGFSFLLFPVSDFAHTIYLLAMGIISSISKHKRWK